MAENSNDKRKQHVNGSAAAGKKITPAKNGAVKKTRKKKKQKHPVLFGIFVFLFCAASVCALTGIIVGSSVLSYADSFINGKSVIDLDNYKSSQSQTSIMYAYDANKNPIEQVRLHGEENRIWVDYDEMPENLLWAFVCLEDYRFYDHSGVDWKRTLAVIIKPAYEGQGASTITQQLIKNLTDQKQVTYNRKFNEILRALNLERYYSKKDILEAYLNTVYLGAGCYGVKTAAETYFGKEVKDLTLAECAMLAASTKAPYTQNPFVDPEKNYTRRKYCLETMLGDKEKGRPAKITKKQFKQALKEQPKLMNATNGGTSSGGQKTQILSWYEEFVIDQVIADLQSEYGYDQNEAWRMVYYGGLSIYSAVDLDVQKKLESSFVNRTGFPYSRRDSKGNLPQAAMTIMDYKGRVVAVAGGTGEKTANRAYNRATDKRAKRQPGSSIKPLAVYAPAIDKGIIKPTSTILEKAITVNGSLWPRNFNGDHGSGSYITVKEALVRSLNTVPVRILKEMLSTKTSFQYCNENFHLNLSEKDMDLSPLAVGGTFTGVTTLEMASAFACFGNGGKYYKPYSYYTVKNRDGEVILDNTRNKYQQAIKEETSSAMLTMLTAAVNQSNGTGHGSKISRFQTFAKTGTTSDNSDKWYCGGTPHYVTAVWYGYDYRANLYTGSSNPAKTIFTHIFSNIHSSLPAKSFSDIFDYKEAVIPNVPSVIGTSQTESTEATKPESETTKKQEEETTVKKPEETTTKKPKETKPTEPSTKEPATVKPTQKPTEKPTAPLTEKPTEKATVPATEAPTKKTQATVTAAPPTAPAEAPKEESKAASAPAGE